MFYTRLLLFFFSVFFLSCAQKEPADLILHNARIYTVDSAFTICEAMAVKNGMIIELGTNAEILNKYTAVNIIDAEGKYIYPGFIDAHCHFVGYGLGLRQVNLTGTRSFKEVLERVVTFSKKEPGALDGKTNPENYSASQSWIVGRGWDQNDWERKMYPNRQELDSLFPDRPVLLMRIDGHAALANKTALMLAGITSQTKVKGGVIELPTGILVDNAVDLVKNKIPPTTPQELTDALLGAQQNCLAQGLTTVDDAGLMKSDVDLIDSLQRNGRLKLRLYAMLSDSGPNYNYYLEKGPYKTDRLNVRAFKFYADGALGSRGACLLKDYSDKPGWKGFLLSNRSHFESYAARMAEKGFQMNTHCIGDSALRMILDIYTQHCTKTNNRRWRIEHAQIVDAADVAKFRQGIIPSVQPTHATSDMYWAAERLGPERVKRGYAYHELLDAASTIALGTDFPVEDISPFKTFYAAVFRKDSNEYPPGGFQKENALNREQALRGMTIWAAYANFEETEKGTLEKGKVADFVMLDLDLMNDAIMDVLTANVLATYIGGEKVYSGK